MAFNKGEWSELYAIFYLLANRKLNLVDCKLNLIANNIFSVESIISKKKSGVIKFKIQNDMVIPDIFGEKIEAIKIEEIIKFKNQVFYNIISGSAGSGSFEIDYVNQWLEKHNIFTNFKAKSGVKEDIFLLNLDLNRNKKIELGYSIKSQLGRPATILNASEHTNIRYIIEGLNDDQINEINSINTKNKLKDRILKIYEHGGKILFEKIVSEYFDKNLRMIDTALPEALAEVLLKSYSSGNKELKELFKTSSIYTSESITYKKLKDFLMAVSFGMFPSKEWNGKFTVNGGLIIVSKNSEVYVIDRIYYEDEVKEFLINETKLDSPSSSRYDMLHLRKENEKIYFTLNLQVRYKN
ncbi:HpaII family restriction endonuclease [Gemella sp. zg-1178]|uniref:HpaII family restriction endonuclease n=1 Tax=Gemella sp. zg-1178 TaxID=2840372 RepID=UPI001C042A90|nr:HpaII family restriction endonuclease [Gemella sp. zg-1178]